MTKHEDNGKRRRDRDRGAERIADNTYLKLVARIVLPIVGGLALFMLVRLVDKFDRVEMLVLDNKTTIAVHKQRLDGIDNTVVSIKNWLRRVSQKVDER